jgi:hypothetical protein
MSAGWGQSPWGIGDWGSLNTVIPGEGTVSLAGAAPSVIVDSLVTPAVGAVSLVGAAPTVIGENLVEPGTGALSVVGQAPLPVVGDGCNADRRCSVGWVCSDCIGFGGK